MINEWVKSGIETAAVLTRRLSDAQVKELLSVIHRRYTDGASDACALWERFCSDVSQMRPDGWSVICEYASESPILLFEDGDHVRGYQFRSGVDLCAVLATSPSFEFYVTRDDAAFVLCHNHHDYLIGVGDCKAWLSSLPR